MTTTEAAKSIENAASVNIVTGESLRNAVELVVQDWVDRVGLIEPKILAHPDPITGEMVPGHPSVMEFIEKMNEAREVANRGTFTGVVLTRADGGPQLAYVGEIPALLYQLMSFSFGLDWQRNEEVWGIFRRLFKIGNLNQNPKRTI